MLGGVPPSARVNREGDFPGPVAPIVPFNTDDEGIALANDTEFGLVAYAFTESLRRAFTVAEQLETGMVGINQGIVSNPAAPLRRRPGVRTESGRRSRGHRGVFGNQVRRHPPVSRVRAETCQPLATWSQPRR